MKYTSLFWNCNNTCVLLCSSKICPKTKSPFVFLFREHMYPKFFLFVGIKIWPHKLMHHKKLVRDFFAKMWKVKYISILLIRQSVKWKKADFSSIVVINVICKSQKCTYNIYWVFLLYYLLESFWVWKVLTIQDSCRIPNFYINTK